MKKKLLFYLFLCMLHFHFFSKPMERYVGSKRDWHTVSFIAKLYAKYEQLRKANRAAEYVVKMLREQWHRDETSLFKKMFYFRAVKMKREAEWEYLTMSKMAVYQKLKSKEENTCRLFDEVFPAKDRPYKKRLLIKFESTLFRLITQLIRCNLVLEDELPIAEDKSFFLLDQFPRARSSIFREKRRFFRGISGDEKLYRFMRYLAKDYSSIE